MNTTPIRHTETWLNSSSQELETILKQVRQLSIIQQKLAPYLEPSLQPYCQVASLSQGKLVLLVANGSVATQLRFQSLDILRKLHEDPELKSIRTIECKVRPTSTSSRLQSPHKPAPTLSDAAANAIEKTATSLEDSALKEIMLKIAKHRQTR